MKIITELKVPVKDAATLTKEGDFLWCDEHEEMYEICICPKPHSTPETDGWQIWQVEGGFMASPTEELYEGLQMWIERVDQELICRRCGASTNHPMILLLPEETHDLVEAFFAIHSKCTKPERNDNAKWI